MRRLLTGAEVAEILQVEEQTLTQWRSRRTVLIPYIKLGGLVRYDEDDLWKWIEEQKTTKGL